MMPPPLRTRVCAPAIRPSALQAPSVLSVIRNAQPRRARLCVRCSSVAIALPGASSGDAPSRTELQTFESKILSKMARFMVSHEPHSRQWSTAERGRRADSRVSWARTEVLRRVLRLVILCSQGPAVLIPLGDPLMALGDTVFVGQARGRSTAWQGLNLC